MKYVIKDGDKILFLDSDRDRLVSTLDFLPYSEADILECEEGQIERGYDGNFYFTGKAPKKPLDLVKREYVAAIQTHMDETVQTRGYDNIFTCVSYLGDQNETYAKEAAAVFAWRSAVWDKGHEILNKVLAGEMELPTVEDVIALLPKLEW